MSGVSYLEMLGTYLIAGIHETVILNFILHRSSPSLLHIFSTLCYPPPPSSPSAPENLPHLSFCKCRQPLWKYPIARCGSFFTQRSRFCRRKNREERQDNSVRLIAEDTVLSWSCKLDPLPPLSLCH